MGFAFAAALIWGAVDYGAAIVSRRIGSTQTVMVGQATSWVLVIAAVLLTSSRAPTAAATIALLSSGAFAAVGYLTFYRGLQVGPIALVSPVTAAYGAVAATLAIAMLGERLTPIAFLAVAFTAGGTVLASARVGQRRSDGGAGIRYALIALVMFGLSSFLLGAAARDSHWLAAVAMARTGCVIALVPLAVRRTKVATSNDVAGIAWAAIVGLFDIVGIAAYARSASLTQISLAAAISSTYPVVPIIAAVALLRERLHASQWFGVILVIAGLVILGFR